MIYVSLISIFLLSGCASSIDLNIPGETPSYAIHKHGNTIEFDKTSSAYIHHNEKENELQ